MNIGFLIPWPLNADLTSYWVLWASIATAIATFLLAFFAWKAWVAAQQTLQGQQNAIELEALGRYVNAINAIKRAQIHPPASYFPPMIVSDTHKEQVRRHNAYAAYIGGLRHDVEVTGAMWRVHHQTIDTKESAFQRAETALVESYMCRVRKFREPVSNEQMEQAKEYADEMLYWVRSYQTREYKRDSLIRLVGTRADEQLLACE